MMLFDDIIGQLLIPRVDDWRQWEVAAPQRLGIRGIWVDTCGCGLPSDADITPYRIINSLSDILR